MAGWAKGEAQRRDLSQVHFLGRHPIELMPHFYAAADALLLTLKREPIFGLTIPGRLQSCLACAQPILAMLDGEGARIVEESGAGLTCPAGDADGLANHALKLAAMSKIERKTMGQSGWDYYKMNFDRTHLIDQLESWLKNTILESKKPK
jgi:glycosyltransferase involved in cell wall biosynthesis